LALLIGCWRFLREFASVLSNGRVPNSSAEIVEGVMKKLQGLALCALVSAALPVAASAQDLGTVLNRPWYAELRAGVPVKVTDDVNVTSNVAAGNGTLESRWTSGLDIAADIGLYVMQNVRVEGDLSVVRGWDGKLNFNQGFTGNAFAGRELDAVGHVTATSFMFNGIYEFQNLDLMGITPFVGAGIGASRIKLVNGSPATARFVFNDSDTVVTGAFILGADIPVPFWNGVKFTGRYTLAVSEGPSFSGTDTALAGGTMTASLDTLVNHTFTFGFRVALN